MAKRLFSLIISTLAFACFASAQNVSTEVQKKHVLIEDITGYQCGNCPDADVIQERLALAQPDLVNIICIHTGSYAEPGMGDPDYTTSVGDELNAYLGATAFPSAFVNRVTDPYYGKIISRSYLPYCSRSQSSYDADVNIWVKSDYDATLGKVSVDVELYYTGNVSDNSSALCIALLQNKMYGQQAGGGSNADEYEHNHVLRAMLTPTWGDVVESSAKGTLVKKHYEYALPAVIGNQATDPLHSDIVAYVIDNNSREVLNSEKCHVTCNGIEKSTKATLEKYKIEPLRNYGFNFLECYVINEGTEAITSADFTVTLNGKETPSSWTGNIASMDRGYVRVPVDFSGQYKGTNEYSLQLTGLNGQPYAGGKISGSFAELINVNDTIISKVKTDYNVADNTYRVLDADGNLVKELGPYDAATEYSDTIVLPKKGFYCFEITDKWGDGISQPRGYAYWYNSLGKQVGSNSDITFHGYRIFFNYGDELPDAPDKPDGPGGDDDDDNPDPVIPVDPNDPNLKDSQWGKDGEFGLLVMPTGTNEYATEMKMGADGTMWWFAYSPESDKESDIRTTTYTMYLQGIDKYGNKKFPGVGKAISQYPNRSWTEIGQYLCCNSDSSVTVVIRDCRNTQAQGDLTFTGYRYDKDGNSMWAEDGVNLDDGICFDVSCGVSICELTNGDNVIAWMRANGYSGQAFYIERCRVTKEGVKADKCDETRIGSATGFYQYPYLVASDNNTYILVYGMSQSLNIYAQKYDMYHKKVWQDVSDRGLKVYSGGWGSVNALQTRLTVKSDGENGMLMGWNDDRNGDGFYADYICWIKSDGTYGFTNEDGGHDIRFTYTEMSQHRPDFYRTSDGKAFIAIISEYIQGSQQWQDLVIQKVDINGNRPWGDDGIFLEPFGDEYNISYTNAQPGAKGQFVVAYQKYKSVYDIANYYSIISEKDGSILLGDSIIQMTPTQRARSRMEVISNPKDEYWLFHWMDSGSDKDNKGVSHCLARVNFSGKIINWIYNPAEDVDAIEKVSEVKSVKDNGKFVSDGKLVIVKNGKMYTVAGTQIK